MQGHAKKSSNERRSRSGTNRGRGKIMSGTITKTDLTRMVRGLNNRVGHPEGVGSYTEYEEGTARATLGYYYLQGEWGGWKLYQIITKTGGVRDVFGCGAVPKRVMYYLLRAYATGLDDGRPDAHYQVEKIVERANKGVDNVWGL